MVTSWDTIDYAYTIMKKHMTNDQIEKVLTELAHKVTGTKSFRQTMQRLLEVHHERMDHERIRQG